MSRSMEKWTKRALARCREAGLNAAECDLRDWIRSIGPATIAALDAGRVRDEWLRRAG